MSVSLRDLVPKYLHTARLTLELIDPNNAEHNDCLLQTINNPLAYASMGDLHVRTHQDFYALAQPLRLRDPRFVNGIAEQIFYLVVRLGPGNPDGELLGLVSFSHRPAGDAWLPPDIGWAFLPEHTGRGYATEAAAEAIRFVREELGLCELICLPNESNPKSNRVAEKLGFVEGGQVANLDEPGVMVNILVLEGMRRIVVEGGMSFKKHD